MIKRTFEIFLVQVGMRSEEFGFMYDPIDSIVYEHIDYLKRSFDAGLSAYKTLFFFNDYLKGDYKI